MEIISIVAAVLFLVVVIGWFGWLCSTDGTAEQRRAAQAKRRFKIIKRDGEITRTWNNAYDVTHDGVWINFLDESGRYHRISGNIVLEEIYETDKPC